MAASKIILRELRLSCLIGTDAAERRARQTLLLDIEVTPKKTKGGDKTPWVDYRVLAEKLRAFAAESDALLLETFAENAAALLLAQDNVAAVRVVCRKPAVFSDIGEAGADITRP